MPSRTFPPLPAHDGVTIETERRVWDGRFPLEEIRFRHRRFDGRISGLRTWELWRRGRAAALLPYDPERDAVVLIEQFRLPALAAGIEPVLVELPAGLCDDGEHPPDTAVRETREEMGLAADRLERIGDFLLTPGGSDELTALFAGRVRAPEPDNDGYCGIAGLAAEQEDIRARVWPAAEAVALALGGAFANSLTALALFWLASRRDWLRARWSTP
ncbi:MAG: NUDIX domain-containing protein [Acetobacteraceae bacterium]|nr:NUDIX domain-containing protein [Acetobacteraceae bacterium]